MHTKAQISDTTGSKMFIYLIKAFMGNSEIMRSLWQFRFGKTNKMLWPLYIFTSHIQTYHNGQPTFVCWFYISSTFRKDNFIPLLSDWFTVAPRTLKVQSAKSGGLWEARGGIWPFHLNCEWAFTGCLVSLLGSTRIDLCFEYFCCLGQKAYPQKW